jgi:hypothetical protein
MLIIHYLRLLIASERPFDYATAEGWAAFFLACAGAGLADRKHNFRALDSLPAPLSGAMALSPGGRA